MISASGHSFEVLCVPFRSELVNFARRLTANADLAEDIVQDALVKAMIAWAGWSPDGMAPEQAARAWLYRIVGNRFANSVRDTRLHRIMQAQYIPDIVNGLYGDVESVNIATSLNDPDAPPTATRTSPFGLYRQMLVSRRDRDPTLLDDEVSIEVLTAIARLHPKRRDVIQRYYFLGETCEVIALELGIPSSSVRTLLGRARAKLAPLLERFARVNYELGGPGVDPHAEAPQRSEPDPDRIKRVVRNIHRRSLSRVKMTPHQTPPR